MLGARPCRCRSTADHPFGFHLPRTRLAWALAAAALVLVVPPRRALHVRAVRPRHLDCLRFTRVRVDRQFELDGLALGEAAEPRRVDVRLVDEDVRRVAVHLDKPEALHHVEPLEPAL